MGKTNQSICQTAILEELARIPADDEHWEQRKWLLEKFVTITEAMINNRPSKHRKPRKDKGQPRGIAASKARVAVNEGFRLQQERAKKKLEEEQNKEQS